MKQSNQNFISKVIADGRITIPKKMRKTQSISEGDFVEVHLVGKLAPKKEASKA